MLSEPSASETTAQALQVIKDLDPRLKAFNHIAADSALAQAKASDEAAARGEWQGLLHGVAVGVKDCLDVAGMPTSDGAPEHERQLANTDSAAARLLRENGAVLMGKTNLSEFCYSIRNDNRYFGDCRNPWDPDRIPGGSSGGSAAAVASGMCRIALGTDTGGSVRLPAALCGISGLRPTPGRISTEGMLGLSVGYDTIGPLAYAVSDVARAFVALSGQAPNIPGVVRQPVENFLPTLRAGVAGLRIGLPRQFYFEELDADVERRVLDAARELERCGATLIDVTVPRAADAQGHVTRIIASDAADLHRERIDNRPDSIEPGIMQRLKIGLAASARDYAGSRRWLEEWKVDLRDLFGRVDVLLTPATPCPAPRIDAVADLLEATRRLTRITYGLSGTGLPGLTVPCGFSESGLPVAMLLTGRWNEEATLLRAGVAYQSRTDFHHARPRPAKQ